MNRKRDPHVMAGIECVEDDALQVWREGDGRRQGNHSVANGKAWE